MNRYSHSKSSLFLMEIILNILFFSILITFCLQIFVKAHTLSEKTKSLHQAVAVCSSIAQICQSTDTSSEAVRLLTILYPDSSGSGNCATIYFDDSFLPSSIDAASYQAAVILSDEPLAQSDIIFSEIKTAEELYTLSFNTYTPASLSEMGGQLNE